MLTDSQRVLMRSYGVLLGRILLGFLFFSSGLSMLLGGVANTAGYFSSLNLPLALPLAYAVITLKIVAGGSLIVGFRTGLAAGALLIFTLLTIPIAHGSLSDMNLFKNLAICGGLLYAIAFGPGEGWKLKQ
jgi:putative oxidoreductase